MPVKFGVPQGSVLGPILFSLFCNDLPDIDDLKEGEIYMYADDTTLYVIAPNHDLVANILNRILGKLYKWCCENRLTPHPDKTEFMLMSRRRKRSVSALLVFQLFQLFGEELGKRVRKEEPIDFNGHEMGPEGRGKVRYIGGWVISNAINKARSYVVDNKLSESTNIRIKINEMMKKIELLENNVVILTKQSAIHLPIRKPLT
ncbi:Hypothetical predicted protein [Paramuricea clavata]|uniref:Uncharacterized protein n=1 Tax=Paramuricea clavata TaxID=317549 RepID=A0A7D9JBA0_PARCT|nr:Hypothetical predicted protein [Paramuricea clavata]